ncbi:protein-glutamate O-methyltransferase CheR [Candidatus Kapabacteria bacterium]|nr:protein-glutamate O-methyltransferase CheR [Candidatus Kapabacteria bacterium]
MSDRYSSKTTNSGNQNRRSSFQMSSTTFEAIRGDLYKLTGIYYTDNKKYLLESRIQRRIDELKLSSFEDYHKLINSFNGRDELNKLFDAITINETYFFRAEFQFEAFENVLAPEIIKKTASYKKTMRIWSAASSSGEEAYTIAMIIDYKLKSRFPDVNFEIIASDINETVIESAKKGEYKDYAIRNIPPDYMRKYFTKKGSLYTISDKIKKMVEFKKINLYDPISVRKAGRIDIAWCCNVLIYFDIPSKQKVVKSLYEAINSNGYLFIGYSESLHGITNDFKLVHLPKAMAYQKIEKR